MTQILDEISYSLFNFQPLNKYIIDGYNMFLSEGLANILKKSAFKVKFRNEEYEFSFKTDKDKINDPTNFPDEYRKTKTEYTFNLNIYISARNIRDGSVIEFPAMVTKIPVMLGSIKCKLGSYLGKKSEERSVLGECEKDPLGYFIMRFEKTLIAQEKMIHNFPYTFVKSQEKFCEMLSQNKLGFTSKIFVYMKEMDKKSSNKTMFATLSRLNSQKGKNLTVLDFLHMYYVGMNTNPNVELEHKSMFDVDIDSIMPDEFANSEANFKEALKDYFGYIKYFIGGEGFENVDFKLWKHIMTTIEKSQKNQSSLKQEINRIYTETSSGTKVKSDEDEEEEEEEIEEDDMGIDEFTEYSKEDLAMMNIINTLINTHYFPHIKDMSMKNMMMMYMAMKLLLCDSDMKPLDDRDDFSMKKIETPGILIQNLFSKSIQIVKKKIIQKIDKKMKEKKKDNFVDQIKGIIQPSKLGETITQLFQHSFVQDTWGDSRTGKKGVAQQVSRHNLAAIYSSIRRCSAHSTRQNKIVKPRMIQPSQYMYIAPEETPDNDRIGLMKHFAVSAYVTHDLTLENIKSVKRKIKKLIEEDEGENPATWVLLDGNPIGFVSDGEAFKNEMINYRRKKIMKNAEQFNFVSVILLDETMGKHKFTMVKISTSGGRLTAPFFTLEKKQLGLKSDPVFIELQKEKITDIEAIMRGRQLNQKQVEIVKRIPELNNFFAYMIRQGLVEFLDSQECQYTNVAVNEEWIEQKNLKFTHMILNPEFMFGIPASLMTFIGHNPAPRISLYDNHIKQAVGVPSFTFQNRMEAHKEKQKVANYPQKRLLGTYMDEIIGSDMLPLWQNAIVAIYPFEGQAQEDAMIVNKSSVERGLFSSTIFQTYSIQKPTKDGLEKLPPEVKQRYQGGIIKEKVPVQKGSDIALKNVSVQLDKLKSFYSKKSLTPKLVKQEKIEEEGLRKIDTSMEAMMKFYEKKKKDDVEKSSNQAFSSLVNEYNTRTGSMKFDVTRELFREFCKKFNVEKLLIEIEQTEEIPVIYKTTVIGKDEPLGYTKVGSGETEHLKAVRFEGEYGVIDKIENYSINDVHRIRVSNFHIAEQGDKIAGPYAQKGIIAALVPEEDMPYCESSGIKPDVLINPLAFGSRLTIGLLLEAFVGKLILSPHVKKISSLKEPFHIPFERIGFPVFDCFAKFCEKQSNWKIICDLRKNMTRLNLHYDTMSKKEKDAELKKLEDNKKEIKILFDKIFKDFAKSKIELSEKDKAFHEFLFGAVKPSSKTLSLTFGPVEEHMLMVDNMKMESLVDNKTFEKFYREIFAREYSSFKDLPDSEKKKLIEGTKKLKEYGKAFKKFSNEELNDLIKDLGLTGVNDQEFMIDGKSGNMIGETLYKINPLNDKQMEKFLKLYLPNRVGKDFNKLNLKQLIAEGVKLRILDQKEQITMETYENIREDISLDNYKEIMELLEKVVVTETRPTPITIGCVSFLILKHYVHDKIQVRDDGAKDIVSRQPVKGKKNDGGPRFGTMERDALISHNVPSFLQERLFTAVDRTRVNFCEKCGHMCTKDKTGDVCTLCRKDSSVLNIPIPYSLKLIADYNTAMGIKHQISFKEMDGPNITEGEYDYQ